MSGSVDRYVDHPQFKFVCGQERRCWTPVTGSVVAAVEGALHYGCHHAGVVANRQVERHFGPWVTVETRPTGMLREAEGIDDERFCSRCFAGVDSAQHHEKCVVTGHAEDGESA